MNARTGAAIGLGAIGTACAISAALGATTACAGAIAIEAAALLALAVFENGRYAGKAPRGPMRPTGERFIDPASGADVTVWVDEQGTREYRTSRRSQEEG